MSFEQNASLCEPEVERWLGVSHQVGPLISYWILLKSDIPVSCTTSHPLSYIDQQTNWYQSEMKYFTENIEPKTNAAVTVPSKTTSPFKLEYKIEIIAEDDDFLSDFNRIIDDASIRDMDYPIPDSFY